MLNRVCSDFVKLTVLSMLVFTISAAGCGSGGSGGTTGTTGGTTNAAGTTSIAGGAGGGGATSSAGTTSTQHPYRAGSAPCVDYPDIGYRVFPNEPFVAGHKRWPTCTLNCTTVQARAGTAMSPLDQALPAGPCASCWTSPARNRCASSGASSISACASRWPPCGAPAAQATLVGVRHCRRLPVRAGSVRRGVVRRREWHPPARRSCRQRGIALTRPGPRPARSLDRPSGG